MVRCCWYGDFPLLVLPLGKFLCLDSLKEEVTNHCMAAQWV